VDLKFEIYYMLPPHLPNKTCSRNARELWIRISAIVILVVLSVFAGITGALVVTAWINPTFYSDSAGLYFVNRSSQLYGSTERPDVLVIQRYQMGTMRLFDKTQKLSGDFYADNARVGQAVMLSSNGWGVSYMPDFNQSLIPKLEAVDYRGISYAIEKVLVDARSGYVYIKCIGNEFHVLPFVNWTDVDTGLDVWSDHGGSWHHRILGARNAVSSGAYNALDAYTRFYVDPTVSKQGIAMTGQGQFVGFVDDNDELHTGWSIEYQLPFVLGNDALDDFAITWNGYFVYRSSEEGDDDVPASGFYISSVGALPRGLMPGDIIIRVQNDTVAPETLHRQLYTAPDEFGVTVWRKGKESDILMHK